MTVDQVLKDGSERLNEAGIGTARLDALVLLEDVTGIDRSRLIAEPGLELTVTQTRKLQNLLSHRAQHEPLAYVLGRTEFYGRIFVITPAVLEPRPESETMIDVLIKLVQKPALRAVVGSTLYLADVGTGSGALGITAKLELSAAQVELLEIDRQAVKVAQTNVDKFTLVINVVESDLLAKSGQINHILLCNLPYVPDDYKINLAASHEPKLAIFGGPDGLDVYRRLFKQVQALQTKPLYILTEALPPQHKTLRAIAKTAGYSLELTDDFIQAYSCSVG